MDRIPRGVVEGAGEAGALDARALPRLTGRARAWAFQIALLASLIFWIVCWHWDTAASMALIWWRSETFAHGMVVYPISLWLIWRNRASLRRLEPAPSLWVVIPLAAVAFAWLMGDLGSVQAARQFALVAMIALTTWLMLGTQVARVMAFPLAFTLLAVPIGEFLLPVLIEHTADFTVGALRLTGIPVYREGNSFVVPSGRWSVVEACSGLRYLIASVMLGLLYAYLTYRSLPRRIAFVSLSVVVPIVANWLRAYMIVMIGHLSGMKLAVGVDHLIYGWIFFGVVMLMLFWLGSFWREDLDGHPTKPLPAQADTAQSVSTQSVSARRTLVAALCAGIVVIAAPSYSEFLRGDSTKFELSLALPPGNNGWQPAAAAPQFRPHFLGARASVERVYERDGARVGVFIAYYAQEREGAELIAFGNAITTSRDRFWLQRDQRRVVAAAGLDSIQTQLRSPALDLTVWHWYWAGSRWTADPRIVKLRQALESLIHRGDDAAVVVLYTRVDGRGADATRVLHAFAEDMAPAFAEALAQARRARTGVRSTQTAAER